MTHIQLQNFKKKKCKLSLKYMPVKQSIPYLIPLMYGQTIQCLNYGEQESKN